MFNRDITIPQMRSIVAVGSPFIDITAEIDKPIYDIYISQNNNQFFNQIDNMITVYYTPGGSIQNTLRICSKYLYYNPQLTNLKLTMLGSVGNDINKKRIINSLEKCRINSFLELIPNIETSKCAIGIYGDQRCIVSDIKASRHLSFGYVEQNIKKIMEHDAILIEGYFIKEKPDIISHLVEKFYNSNKLILLTLCDTFSDQHKNDIIEIAKKSDMIFGNIRAKNNFFSNLNNFRKDFWFIETAGRGGVKCHKYNTNTKQLDFIRQVFPKKIITSQIVDKNGAFDAFLGGFLSQQMQGENLDECCNKGNEAASEVLKKYGCVLN